MDRFLVLAACTVMFALQNTECRRIIFPLAQVKSHITRNLPIARELIRRGHDVHFVVGTTYGPRVQKLIEDSGAKIVWFEQKNTGLDFDDVVFDALSKGQRMGESIWDFVALVPKLTGALHKECEDMFADEKFMQEIRAHSFDFAVSEFFSICPCISLLPINISVPFVLDVGQYDSPSYRVPGLPSFTYSVVTMTDDKPSFVERLVNTVLFLKAHIVTYAIAGKSLLIENAPGLNQWLDIPLKAELLYMAKDHILSWPVATLPHLLMVPGTTYGESKPLEKDFESIVKASESVIVVSFGSVAGKLPTQLTNKFIHAFNAIPDTVFMSYSGDVSKIDQPTKNVHIRKWLPQNDLLGNPKTRMFITHGGHNGQIESIYHGVPMITMPLFADQSFNAFRAKARGFGVTLNMFEFTPQELVDAIDELKQNLTYTENAKRMSAILKDQPLHPAQVLANGIEHVMKHGGKHLRSSALDMPLYEFLMLDVLIFLYVIMTLLLVMLWCCLRACVRCFCRRVLQKESTGKKLKKS